MKPWWQSKTIWANVLGGALLLLNGPLGHVVPPQYLALVLAVINIGLRVVTTQAVTAS